jgi:hypothetical protein
VHTHQPSLHPRVTFNMAVADKTYSLIDSQLVAEEAFEIDPNECARLIVLHMASRDAQAAMKMKDARLTMAFLHILDEFAPVLWLNAVSGVYRSREVYDDLVM